jgi:hypothetical protein
MANVNNLTVGAGRQRRFVTSYRSDVTTGFDVDQKPHEKI